MGKASSVVVLNTNSPIAPVAHGGGVRGLTTVEGPGDYGGRFSRLFPASTEMGDIPDETLEDLARAMVAKRDPPKDEPDPEESDIPAAYTYFGQFVDHDLTFDPSTFQQQRSDPAATLDYRTPRFDLDSVYGRGPDDQPYLYENDGKLVLGDLLRPVERNDAARDLPRAPPNRSGTRRALIGDPRNDENIIVSQLHGMFLRFHDKMLDHRKSEFADVQRLVRWHYQWLVLHDYLPRIVSADVLEDISPAIADTDRSLIEEPPRLVLDIPTDRFGAAAMPVEFSAAAYRFGHSMVRPGYRLNEHVEALPIFALDSRAGKPVPGLNGFDRVLPDRTVDWQRFLDLGKGPKKKDNTDRVQYAYCIDTSLVDPLGSLPKSVAGSESGKNPRLKSLAYRNLLRGKKLLLPSGQEVARRMGLSPLSDDQILIGKAEAGPKGRPGSETRGAVPISSFPALRGKCPLWAYVLAEARRGYFHGRRAALGPVGGRIVAEVFLFLLRSDRTSFLSAEPNWKPARGFELKDLLLEALAYREPATEMVRRTSA
jgi:hypothetical protein